MVLILVLIGLAFIAGGGAVGYLLDSVAAIDIACTLAAAGAVVLGLAGVARAIDRAGRRIALAIEDRALGIPSPPLMEPLAPPVHPALADDEDERLAPLDDRFARLEEEREAEAAEPAAPAVEEPAPPQPRHREAAPTLGTPDRHLTAAAAPAPVHAPRLDIAPEPMVPPSVEEEEAEPEPEERAEPAVEHPPAAEHPGHPAPEAPRRLMRSGTLAGVLYRFYSDGSVEAETNGALRRFASIEELRETILTMKQASAATAGPQPAPSRPSEPTAAVEAAGDDATPHDAEATATPAAPDKTTAPAVTVTTPEPAVTAAPPVQPAQPPTEAPSEPVRTATPASPESHDADPWERQLAAIRAARPVPISPGPAAGDLSGVVPGNAAPSPAVPSESAAPAIDVGPRPAPVAKDEASDGDAAEPDDGDTTKTLMALLGRDRD